MTPVLAERSGATLRLTLNRPDRLNAVSEALYDELLARLRDADAQPDVRAVVLAGSGRAFCVGADQKAHGAGARTPEQRARYVELAWRVCDQIQTMSTPVVASVHGYALGAGAEIATSADFMVIADDAQIGFPEVSIGTFVGGGVTRRLPRLVGLRRATDLLILGERCTGRQAAAWGLAHSSVPADDLGASTDELARKLASKAPISLARMKSALRGEQPMDAVLRSEARDLLEIMATQDWAEGVAAFAERRDPVFRGR
ncbi:enoyl-CoA hydratase/isomerase family protein [Pseudonocardia acaciae]|uniref:enoyl-CoA hydratase/isomerase family protein n=1 Tax=Pseudonocardia acaciae TaxID=551276 RepID=UPI0006866772|nr:enoyl-CoA hydratase-related protein [Pseudonocardia acaciae]